MAEQKFTDTTQNTPTAGDQGLPRPFNWQNLFDNRRVLWLLAALLIVSIATTIATLQPLRPNALVQPKAFTTDWWLHPVETNAFKRLPVIPENLNAIAILPGGDKTLVAVGDSGLIVRSRDGGRNWNKINVPFQALPQQQQQFQQVEQQQAQEIQQKVDKKQKLKEEPAQQEEPAPIIPLDTNIGFLSADLMDVFFVDAQRGWAVGGDGTVLTTSDGGDSWRAQGSGVTNRINSVQFIDAQRGWAVDNAGTVLTTGDGGANWQRQRVGKTDLLNSVWFVDAQRGWAVGGSGAVLATSDGGGSWQAQSSGTTSTLYSVQFIDAQRGWAVGSDGTALTTSDGGRRWQAQRSGITSTLHAVRFVDARHGWAVGSNSTVLTTSDGGVSWQAQNSGTASWLQSVQLVDAQRGWAVGEAGTVLATSDGGVSWQAQSSGTNSWLHSVQFIDAQRGWAVGDDGTILITSDGGASWQAQNSGTIKFLNWLWFLDAQRGWAVGENGIVIATSDGGVSWQAQDSGTKNTLRAVQFVDAQRGWAMGYNGTILTTSDGGANWQAQNSGTRNTLFSAQFVNAQRGWAVGDAGTVLATSDGGANWQAQVSGTTSTLFSVQFLDDESRGWAVGRKGTVLATNDGGARWQAQESDTSIRLQSVQFVDGQNGWVVGDAGTVLTSSDGGASWQAQNSGTIFRLHSVQFIDAQRGWAVGHRGTVLTTSDGGANWADVAPLRYPAPWYYVSWLVALILLLPALNPKSRRSRETTGDINTIANQVTSDRPLQESDQDKLGFGRIARSVSRFLRHEKTTGPLTMAVSGRWGTGKSSLMNLISTDLQRHGFVPVWFNSWHHQNEENLVEALVTSIRQQGRQPFFTSRPPFINPYWFAFLFRRLFRWSADHYLQTLLLVCTATVALTFYGHDQSRLRTHIDQVAQLINPPETPSSATDADAMVKEISSTAVTEQEGNKEITRIETEETIASRPEQEAPEPVTPLVDENLDWIIGLLSSLIALAGGPVVLIKALQTLPRVQRRAKNLEFRGHYAQYFRNFNDNLRPVSLIVFIDDLDRCDTTTVMRALEATNYLVSSGNCFVILGMDYNIVRNSVAVGYDSLTKKIAEDHGEEGKAAFANEYLEKLINIQLEVPELETTQMLDLALPETQTEPPSATEVLVQRIQQHWMQYWRLIFLAGVVVAGFQLGNYLHGVAEIEETVEPAQSSQKPTDPAQLQTTEEGLPGAVVVGDKPDPARSPAGKIVSPAVTDNTIGYIYLPIAVIVLVGIWVMMRGRDDIQYDSSTFERALGIWLPLASRRRETPRAVKRFVNRTRYFAMRLRDERENSKTERDDEATIVALSAILQINPDAIDLPADDVLAGIARLEKTDTILKPETFDATVELIGQMADTAIAEHDEAFQTSLAEQIKYTLPLFREISKGIQIK